MNPDDSWSSYVRKIQEYLDSDLCLIPGLMVEPEGGKLRLSRDGMRETSEIALQSLSEAIEYADYFIYDPSEDDDDWEDMQFNGFVR